MIRGSAASTAVLALLLTAAGGPATAQGRPSPHQRPGTLACTDCHTTGGWREVRFDHARTRYPLAGQHAAVPCSGCHDLRDFSGAGPAACGRCHQDPHRGDAGPRCEQCHRETGWLDVDAATAHARTRLPDLGVHAALLCRDCHRSTGVQMFHRPVAECVACHRPTYDATTNPAHRLLGFSVRCERCHQLATWAFALFREHDGIFPVYVGAHAGTWTTCARCHPDPANYRLFTCTTCHAQGPTTAEHQGIPGYTWESAACLGCHPAGGEGDLSFHEGIFPIFSDAHAGAWAQCAQCHADPADRRVISCLGGGCHAPAVTDPAHQSIPGYGYTTAQCRTCHPDGRAGGFAQHDAVFPIYSGPHAGAWSQCAQCHTDPADRRVVTCIGGGCHAQPATDQVHLSIPGYAYSTAQCRSCHPDGRAGTFAQHDALFPIYTGKHAGRWASCATCHPDPSSRRVITCSGTGCHQRAQMDDKHREIAGYAFEARVCLTCHPDGRKPTAGAARWWRHTPLPVRRPRP